MPVYCNDKKLTKKNVLEHDKQRDKYADKDLQLQLTCH